MLRLLKLKTRPNTRGDVMLRRGRRAAAPLLASAKSRGDGAQGCCPSPPLRKGFCGLPKKKEKVREGGRIPPPLRQTRGVKRRADTPESFNTPPKTRGSLHNLIKQGGAVVLQEMLYLRGVHEGGKEATAMLFNEEVVPGGLKNHPLCASLFFFFFFPFALL